jgi:hypothetical protein
MMAQPCLAEADSSCSVDLHAELFPNIRQLPLYVSLQNIEEEFDWNISLSESRRAVIVSLSHNRGGDVIETLKLPARVLETTGKGLKFAGKRVESERSHREDGNRISFSFRLQVDNDEWCDLSKDTLGDNFIPWTATAMSTCMGLRCRFCDHVFLDSCTLRPSDGRADTATLPAWTWKDLPSANWAEMMDFWHCHKPDTHDHSGRHEEIGFTQDRNALTKGYGAANQIMAISGTTLVDIGSFLVSEADCRGLKKELWIDK